MPRFVPVLLLLLAIRPALALDCDSASRLLFDHAETTALIQAAPERCAIAPWGPPEDRVVAVALALEGNSMVVALVRHSEEEALVIAGPDTIEALGIDPFWSVALEVLPPLPLGPMHPHIAIRVANSYLSTGRSSASTALHLVLLRGDRLVLGFAGWLAYEHNGAVPCARRDWIGPACRSGFARRFEIGTTGTPPPGMPPDILVRDGRTRLPVSRHRWRGDHYDPPAYDPLPPMVGG